MIRTISVITTYAVLIFFIIGHTLVSFKVKNQEERDIHEELVFAWAMAFWGYSLWLGNILPY